MQKYQSLSGTSSVNNSGNRRIILLFKRQSAQAVKNDYVQFGNILMCLHLINILMHVVHAYLAEGL